MVLLIKRKDTGEVHQVNKYVLGSDNQTHVWCNTWYGHHIIGKDCEYQDTLTYKEKWEEQLMRK